MSLPKIGLVPAVLRREMEGEVKSATIKQEANGKWAISFVSHFDAPDRESSDPLSPVGLDAGLETFVTTSDGDKTPPPHFYRKQECKLRKAQRQEWEMGSDLGPPFRRPVEVIWSHPVTVAVRPEWTG